MEKDTTNTQTMSMTSRDALTNILQQGAQKMLAEATENEVAEYLDHHACVRDDQSHRLAVGTVTFSEPFKTVPAAPLRGKCEGRETVPLLSQKKFHPQYLAISPQKCDKPNRTVVCLSRYLKHKMLHQLRMFSNQCYSALKLPLKGS